MSSTPTKSTGLGVGGSMLDDILRKSFNEKAEDAFETVPVDDDFEYSIWVSCSFFSPPDTHILLTTTMGRR
jgi:hypothetical protein